MKSRLLSTLTKYCERRIGPLQLSEEKLAGGGRRRNYKGSECSFSDGSLIRLARGISVARMWFFKIMPLLITGGLHLLTYNEPSPQIRQRHFNHIRPSNQKNVFHVFGEDQTCI